MKTSNYRWSLAVSAINGDSEASAADKLIVSVARGQLIEELSRERKRSAALLLLGIYLAPNASALELPLFLVQA